MLNALGVEVLGLDGSGGGSSGSGGGGGSGSIGGSSGMMLIGGGRTASEGATLDALLELPLFIQPGVRDFARPGAVALIEQLEAAGHPRLTHRIVPDCEHLTVVQVALDQCFEWMQWLLDQRTE